MARIVKLVSDISGTEANESEFCSLVVREHPKIDSPRQLDVLPSEVDTLRQADNLVVCEIKNNGDSREVVVSLTDFRKIVSDEAVVSAQGTRGRRKGFSPSA